MCSSLFFFAFPVAAAVSVNTVNGNWSNPTIWNTGHVPGAGDEVQIAPQTSVLYDIRSEMDLSSVTVDGTLIFSQSQSTNLDTGRLIISDSGYLEIGTEARPLPHHITARIRLTEDAVAGENNAQHGAFLVMGRAELHGAPKHPAFTKLERSALPGKQKITLSETPTGWQVGDEIVLGGERERSETARIAHITGNTLHLDAPLQNDHPVIIHRAPTDNVTSSVRTDVGNLTRNLKIMSKYPEIARGHTMVTGNGAWRVSYVEYRSLGGRAGQFSSTSGMVQNLPQPLFGRYPIHLHELGTVSDTQAEHLTAANTISVKGCVIVDTQNHALVIAGTDRALIEDTIAYDTLGHAFTIGETGTELENMVRRNLAVRSQLALSLRANATSSRATLREQSTDAAGFWFGNLRQIAEHNIASDVQRGFGAGEGIARAQRSR